MATDKSNTPLRGRIPASALSTTRIYPIDLVAAEALPGLASAVRHGGARIDLAKQATAMNAVLVALNALLVEGGVHA